MARQFAIPGGPYVNAAEDGREYALPGYGYLNEETETAAVGNHRVIGGGWGGRVIAERLKDAA